VRLLTILISFLAGPALADITGNVVRVLDGDTIIVQDAGEKHRVRLTGIDAPESKQDHGNNSRRYLAVIIDGKDVKIQGAKRDRYGRLLGKVVYQGKDINLHMVEEGHAWWYRRYKGSQSRSDQKAYRQGEDMARSAKLGLWSGKPVPPWEFRRQ